MIEQLWSEDHPSNDNIYVSIVETIDAITGKVIFIAMADDTSKFIGKGENFEDAVTDLEIQMYDVDEFDDEPWELELAS